MQVVEKDENYLPKKVRMTVEVEIDVTVKVRPPRHPDQNTLVDVSTKAFKGMSVSGAAEPNMLDYVTHELLARLCEKAATIVNKAIGKTSEPTPVPDEPFDLSPLRPYTQPTYAAVTARPWSLIEPTQPAADPIILPYSAADLERHRSQRDRIAEAARERYVQALNEAAARRQTQAATELEAAGNEGEDNGADINLDEEPPF